MIRWAVVALFLAGCGSASADSTGCATTIDADAGSCEAQSVTCLEAAQITLDVAVCRAQFEACKARETDGGL